MTHYTSIKRADPVIALQIMPAVVLNVPERCVWSLSQD